MLDLTRRMVLFGILAVSIAALACSEQGGQPLEPSNRFLEPTVLWGEDDGFEHPWVGLVVTYPGYGNYVYICSGSLLRPNVVLTAGHCTDGAALTWFTVGNPLNLYTFPNWRTGTSYTHPGYDDFATFPNTSDVGVVVLDSPILLAGGYGQLTDVGVVDDLATRRGKKNQIFTIVGFGDSGWFPFVEFDVENLVRHQGHPQLVEINSDNTGGYNIHFSSNPGKRATGGSCFGDSGGPAIYPGSMKDIVGVGSFVYNNNCVGAGTYYRVDTTEAQEFINGFLP